MKVPCWITSILSAFLIEEKRCAITKEVRPVSSYGQVIEKTAKRKQTDTRAVEGQL
jgi:hypothetical protein